MSIKAIKVGDDAIIKHDISSHGLRIGTRVTVFTSYGRGKARTFEVTTSNGSSYAVGSDELIPFINQLKKTDLKKPVVKKEEENNDKKISKAISDIVSVMIDSYWDNVEIEKAHNSCGIVELDNIGDGYLDAISKNGIHECIDDYNNGEIKVTYNYTTRILEEFKREFFSTFVKRAKLRAARAAFIMISIVKDAKSANLAEFLDLNCHTCTDWKVNPNSHNNIKVWLFKI